jgi:hypothetical protein
MQPRSNDDFNTGLNCEGGEGLEYVPGDANMFAGLWPPTVIGGDVTYLVNYFRGLSEPCILDGFYCAGDANGDCLVIGGDVTFLVGYFRGLSTLGFCPDHPTAWESGPPSTEPAGWPNCESVAASSITIEKDSNLKLSK